MTYPPLASSDRILIIGGTGFVGKRLIPELVKKNVKLRLLVRDLARASSLLVKGADIEIVQGDLMSNAGLPDALQGIRTAILSRPLHGREDPVQERGIRREGPHGCKELHGSRRNCRP